MKTNVPYPFERYVSFPLWCILKTFWLAFVLNLLFHVHIALFIIRRALGRTVPQLSTDVDEQLAVVYRHGEEIQSPNSQICLNLHSFLSSSLHLAQIKALGLHLVIRPALSLSRILYSISRWASRSVYRDETYFQWHKTLFCFMQTSCWKLDAAECMAEQSCIRELTGGSGLSGQSWM